MQGDRTPEEIARLHPSTFIAEELEARGWSLDRLALEMGGDFGINRLSLDFYFKIGPDTPEMLIGETTAAGLSRALGVSAEFFTNLEAAWLASVAAFLASDRGRG